MRHHSVKIPESLNSRIPKFQKGAKAEMGEVLPYIPPELVWDYKDPPADLLWRLQRIADFFPAYGTDQETVDLLFGHLGDLDIEAGTSQLITLYHEVWHEADRD